MIYSLIVLKVPLNPSQSRVILHVEGFSLQRPNWRLICCSGLILCIPSTLSF